MLDYIRIACAVPPVKVGDVEKNAEEICIRMNQADEQQADILLFGHTHRAECFREGPLWVMNPGSIGRGSPCTYGVITIADGKVDCATHQI